LTAKILIVDDEDLIRWSLAESLKADNYEILTARSGEEALRHYSEESPDIVLMDIKMPGIDGIEALKRIKEIDEFAQVIMITAFADVNTAIKAMKAGAVDYIIKPFNIDEVKVIIEKSFESLRLKREYTKLKETAEKRFESVRIIGKSEHIKNVLALAERVSNSDVSCILITGESGVGKELIARTIHFNSERRKYPFMEIDCTSLSPTLIESELFGHEKGAFTDAKTMKRGLLEISDGGTVFLDEIAELPLSSQAKLLRFIETRTFKRVGGVRDIKVDVRIIAATNRNLEEYIKEKKFREDLYFRLNVVPINVPPLRERKEDIPLLIEFFIEQFNKKFKKNIKGLDDEAKALVMEYLWPGNVRELKNSIERAVLLSTDEFIMREHLLLNTNFLTMDEENDSENDKESVSTPLNLEEVEKNLLIKALQESKGNKSLAARLLGVTRDTLRYRMKKYGIEE
jgi:DNA-binding NtrC family response regulator